MKCDLSREVRDIFVVFAMKSNLCREVDEIYLALRPESRENTPQTLRDKSHFTAKARISRELCDIFTLHGKDVNYLA